MVPQKPVRKPATEEAFCIPEVAAALRKAVQRGGTSLDLPLLSLIFDPPKVPPADAAPGANRDQLARALFPRLLDVDEGRLVEMDAHGVDMHILSLTMPGVQLLDRATAVSLARVANDRLSEAIRRHPTRFAGLASFAPQDPAAAAKEMERAIQSLQLNGFLVNSHTESRYLDEERFWPILEAAEALGAPLYLHPRAVRRHGGPVPRVSDGGRDVGLRDRDQHPCDSPDAQVLDRFPRLRIVLGHMGEGLPFGLWRLDFMGAPGARGASRKNQLKPGEYFRRNFAITTSGVEDPLALRFCIDKLGIDSVLWAIDYPFQPTAPAVAFIENAPLTDEERAKVAYRNAERLFRIGQGR